MVQRIGVDTVQQVVSTYFGLDRRVLRGPRRHPAVVRPRMIAMYLSRKLVGASFPQIGRDFGGRDHSTAISAVNKISRLMESDLRLREEVELLERRVQLEKGSDSDVSGTAQD